MDDENNTAELSYMDNEVSDTAEFSYVDNGNEIVSHLAFLFFFVQCKRE